jgi:hypothetical protein
LEYSAPSKKEKDFVTCLTAGEGWAWGHQRFLEVSPPQIEIGLVHWIGSNFIRKPLGTKGLKEGTVGVVGE